MYENTRCFHTSGITLGLGGPVRENAIEMMKKFKEKGARISFDVTSEEICGPEMRQEIALQRFCLS